MALAIENKYGLNMHPEGRQVVLPGGITGTPTRLLKEAPEEALTRAAGVITTIYRLLPIIGTPVGGEHDKATIAGRVEKIQDGLSVGKGEVYQIALNMGTVLLQTASELGENIQPDRLPPRYFPEVPGEAQTGAELIERALNTVGVIDKDATAEGLVNVRRHLLEIGQSHGTANTLIKDAERDFYDGTVSEQVRGAGLISYMASFIR